MCVVRKCEIIWAMLTALAYHVDAQIHVYIMIHNLIVLNSFFTLTNTNACNTMDNGIRGFLNPNRNNTKKHKHAYTTSP